jgi:NAD-dependent dihydropyrimidine dehydrogenase PreA subunit
VSKNGKPVALFIDIEIDDSVARDPDLVKKLVEVCPVDIYAQAPDGTLEIVRQNLDECVLCDLCVEAAPEDTVRVIKLYEKAGFRLGAKTGSSEGRRKSRELRGRGTGLISSGRGCAPHPSERCRRNRTGTVGPSGSPCR